MHLTHEQPLWTVLCDWQEILYPPHWDSYSPLIKSSWERAGQLLGRQHKKGLRNNQPSRLISQGVQTLLPELEADLCLSGEIVLQRSNPLVLKLKEADPSELHQCFKFLKFYHSSVVIWSPLCATTLCIYLIRATSLWPQRKIPCSLLQISKFYGGLCLVLCI